MAKIVKYCNACDESFAEKFGFCPICGVSLNAFEMNPVDQTKNEEKPETVVAAADTVAGVSESYAKDSSATMATSALPETKEIVYEPLAESPEEVEIELELSDKINDGHVEPLDETVSYFTQPTDNASDDVQETEVVYDDFTPASGGHFATRSADKDFYVTVLTEKNVKQRNVLLLGTMILMVSLCLGVIVVSIFNHPLLVGAIGEDELGAFVPVIDEVPMTVEEEKKQDNDKDAGGGGGGGRDAQTPTSKGRLATQTENPLMSPTYTIPQKDNFELKYPVASTQGNRDIPQTEEPYGDPNSKYDLSSDGRGTGGGQGSGEGTGQGSGRGTGAGSGTGSGLGGGRGDGEGDGTGDGRNSTRGGTDTTPPASGPSKKVTFLSKPQPRYTDAARINNVQGLVVLKITFLSNGQIGNISQVKGLSHGLTEQAIAAARQIRFDPALKNGQKQSVTMNVQYTFTIY